jgi:hypothetical protein
MISRATWIWLLLALVIGCGLFQLKYRVQELEQKLAQTNRDILTNEEAIHVLKADWSYLNRPEKIDPLARRFLDLGPFSGKQYVSFADLPMRAVQPASSPVLPSGAFADPKAPAAPALEPSAEPAPSTPISPVAMRKPTAPGGMTLAKDIP